MTGGVPGRRPPNPMPRLVLGGSRSQGRSRPRCHTLLGRLVTVTVNGTTVIAEQLIPGITGGALGSDEGAPGPLMLQGDHGPVEYRDIVLTPVVESGALPDERRAAL